MGKNEREEGIEKERMGNNSKQSYIYLKLCGQQARVSGRVCFISKGLIEKRKEQEQKNLERGLNPSVGNAKQEQDQQQQQESNKNKRKATTTRQTIKTHEKYLNSIIIQQRNTKASKTKQHKIETKQNKKEKRADYKTNETNKGTQVSHSFQNLKYFLHSNLFSLLKPLLCLFVLISHTHQNQATKF